jgi:hypothetical protein
MSFTDKISENRYCTDTSNSNANCTYWTREDGREFITDPNGKIVNLARLTAYAEHGEKINDAEAHHELPTLKVDAPAFLAAIPKGEHLKFHSSGPTISEIDGIPRHRVDG